MIARSTPWGTIQFGDAFYQLTEMEQCAVIAHEQGHIHHRHALKRLWWMVSFQWKGFFERCEAQELEADAYAVAQGHSEGLYSVLAETLNPYAKAVGYPTTEKRLEAIHG